MSLFPQCLIYKQESTLFNAAADYILNCAQKAIMEQGRFSLAISGGKTPDRLFMALLANKNDIDISKVHLFWVDERCVKHSDSRSNYGRANKLFLPYWGIPPANIHPIPATLSHAAEFYTTLLRQKLPCNQNNIPIFDLVVLGLGTDGHTASIFPEALDLQNSLKVVAKVSPPQFATPQVARITLSIACLQAAKAKIFLAPGTPKHKIFKQIFTDDSFKSPAKQLPNAIWFLSGSCYYQR